MKEGDQVKGRLTEKQETFVRLVIELGNQRQAFKLAYPNTRMTDPQIDCEASAMLNATGKYKRNPKIHQRYQELLQEVRNRADRDAERAVLTRLQRMKLLSEIATDTAQRADWRVRAISELNHMDGEYISRVEVSGMAEEMSKLDDLISQMRGGEDE